MSESHRACLSLGSNIEPEVNLPKAVDMLSRHGHLKQISNVWESEPVGTTGPNYLNACTLFEVASSQDDLKESIIGLIERQLGRRRGGDKYAPRPIDIDIVIFDGNFIDAAMLDLAYVVVPLAEIHPGLRNPVTGETLLETATRLRRVVWLKARRGVLG
jgi:2-amino-4-hydroxy-6-hydroxymethyldihydropteridine diphosphokinase